MVREGAAGGYAKAMFNLALLYYNGEGVKQDYAQARQRFEKAAAAGNTEAMYSLGIIYEFGVGVLKNYKQARNCYENAPANGERRGC